MEMKLIDKILHEATVYHGTDDEFEDYVMSKAKRMGKFGIWFTEDKSFAEQFGMHVKTANIDLKNPYTITAEKWDAIRGAHARDENWFANWKQKLINNGHDGLKVLGGKMKFGNSEVMNPTIYAVFDVKSISKLNEIGDSKHAAPIKYMRGKYTKANDEIATPINKPHYKFEVDGAEYEVEFSVSQPSSWSNAGMFNDYLHINQKTVWHDVCFKRRDKWYTDKENNPKTVYRVMNTIFNAIRKFAKAKKVNHFYFFPVGNERRRLYLAYLKYFGIKHEIYTKNGDNYILFWI